MSRGSTLPPETIRLDGWTWLPEQTSIDGLTRPSELRARADKLMRQNGSTQLPVNTSRRVDLATRADTSRRDFAAGANMSRWFDLVARADTSRWVALPPEQIRLDGSTWPMEPKSPDGLTWLPEPTSLQLEPTSVDCSTWSPEPTSLDKSTCLNRSTQLPVDTSRGSTWPPVDTPRRVNFAAGANTSRWVDVAARADKSRWVD